MTFRKIKRQDLGIQIQIETDKEGGSEREREIHNVFTPKFGGLQ